MPACTHDWAQVPAAASCSIFWTVLSCSSGVAPVNPLCHQRNCLTEVSSVDFSHKLEIICWFLVHCHVSPKTSAALPNLLYSPKSKGFTPHAWIVAVGFGTVGVGACTVFGGVTVCVGNPAVF